MKSNHFLRSDMSRCGSLFVLLAIGLVVFSCTEKPKAETVSLTVPKSDSVRKKYTTAMVDNKKDPSCGMPMTAGIEDTVHFNGKVYGFCSDECKQIFLKNPVSVAKNTEMKN